VNLRRSYDELRKNLGKSLKVLKIGLLVTKTAKRAEKLQRKRTSSVGDVVYDAAIHVDSAAVQEQTSP